MRAPTMSDLFDLMEEVLKELLALATADGDKARIRRIKATQKKLRAARDKRTGIPR